MVEAESEANANAALLEAQALDIRAVSSAAAPEILEYRFQQDVLERLATVANRLPQVVQIGALGEDDAVDFLEISRRMIGTGGEPLFTPEDMQAIRDRMEEIQARIRGEGGEQSALSTLILARLLPQLTADGSTVEKASEALRNLGDGEG
jgi:hypothetical protein